MALQLKTVILQNDLQRYFMRVGSDLLNVHNSLFETVVLGEIYINRMSTNTVSNAVINGSDYGLLPIILTITFNLSA